MVVCTKKLLSSVLLPQRHLINLCTKYISFNYRKDQYHHNILCPRGQLEHGTPSIYGLSPSMFPLRTLLEGHNFGVRGRGLHVIRGLYSVFAYWNALAFTYVIVLESLGRHTLDCNSIRREIPLNHIYWLHSQKLLYQPIPSACMQAQSLASYKKKSLSSPP